MSEGLPVPAVCGGAVENLVQALLDENEKDPHFEFSVFSLADPRAEHESKKYSRCRFFFFQKENRPIFRQFCKRLLPAPFYLGDPFILAILRKMRGRRFDAILIENTPRYAILLRKAFPTTPIAHHFHNRKLWRGCRYERQIVRASDAYLCVSDFICRDVLSARGVSRKHVFCCYNGIDVARFSGALPPERRAELRSKFGLSSTDFVFLFSGRIVKEKGIDVLLDAFCEIEEKIPNARLLLLGANVVEKKTATWNKPLSNNVIFTGLIPYEEMPDMLKLGDVAVLPSTGIEAFSLSMLECLCAGTPTIATDSGGMAEIAEDDAAKIVARGCNLRERLAAAMFELYESKNLRQTLAEKGAKRGTLFSRERYWRRFCEIFSELLSTTFE